MELLRPVKELLGGKRKSVERHNPVVERVNDTLTGSLVNRSELGNAGRDIAFYAETRYHEESSTGATTRLYQSKPGDDPAPFIEAYFELGDEVRCPGFSTNPENYESGGTLPPIEEMERTVIAVLEGDPELDYDPQG